MSHKKKAKSIPLHSISTSPSSQRRASSSTEYESSESSDEDVGGPPPLLPRRGKTYAKLVSDNRDLPRKRPPMPRRGNTYAKLIDRKKSLLKNKARPLSTVVTSPRVRNNSAPTHKRKSTGSIVSEMTSKPPPLPPRKSSRSIKRPQRQMPVTPPTSPAKSEVDSDLPVVWVNVNPSPGLKIEFPSGKWKVTVPKGRVGGQRLRITLSEDTDVRVLIPEGLKTGDKFLVRHNSVAQFDTFSSAQSSSSGTLSFLDSGKFSSGSYKRGPAPLKLEASQSFEDKLKQRFDRLRGLHISVTTWNVESTSPSSSAISAVRGFSLSLSLSLSMLKCISLYVLKYTQTYTYIHTYIRY